MNKSFTQILCSVALSAVSATCFGGPVNTTVNYNSMVTEGRTWWYDAFYYGAIEYGIRIGSTTDIDGEKWNKVYVCLHHKDVNTGPKPYDMTHEWVEYNEISGLLGYMREEDGKVYVKIPNNRTFAQGCYPYAVIDNSLLFDENGDQTVKIYDFSSSDGTFTLGNEQPDVPSLKFNVIEQDSEESCGNTYLRQLCVPDYDGFLKPDKVYFTQGIGVTDEIFYGNHQNSLFYAPFHQPMTGGMTLNSLKYVTDSENNIIYEGAGGTKLWEQFREAMVRDITVDTPASNIEYYNLQGQRVAEPASGSTVIRRQGTSVSKVLIP